MIDPPDAPAPDGEAAAEPAAEPAAEAAPGDLRAKDLLVRSEEEIAALEAAMSPAELAELSSWFARPSREVVEEQAAAAAAVAERSAQEAARDKRLAELAAQADPRLVALLERHETSVASYYHPIPPPAPIIDPTILRIRVRSPEEEAQVADGREYERSPDVTDDLGVSAPQAVLRDLFRPVTEYTAQFVSPFFGEDAPMPEDPWIEIRQAVRERRRSMPDRLDTYAIGAAAKREFRDHIAGSWVEKVEIVKALHAVRDGIAPATESAPAEGAPSEGS